MEKRILRFEDDFWRIRTDTGELADAERNALRTYSQTKFICVGNFPFGVNKEVVGIRVFLTGSLFACDILRKLLPRVSLAKLTSAPARF